ncbi:MAG: hypothetical protein V3T58_06115 [Candidatus Hydrothermarchaeales archaeon]
MKKEIEGVLVREKDEPGVKTEDGKVKLVFNLLDGFAGKKVRITIKEVKD